VTSVLHPRLVIGPISLKFDRNYAARDRDDHNVVHTVNVAQLRCSCPDFATNRAAFPSNDPRRVCAHLYDKLYSTKAEKGFDLLVQLFVRYGRTMLSFHIVDDDFGVLLLGQPFGPRTVRAIGVVADKPLVATYDLTIHGWSEREPEPDAAVADRVLEGMRAAYPSLPW
jgi:hypothetical protein